ncbi:hypothetical protein [Salinicola endophyticus]|uniref:hypothetical protein n=1 Tax=Salinicola endophyticus TaxID=1949083 RepID=UPI000DA23A54|nr:hypothetical protein [Salinicola endophyticus]
MANSREAQSQWNVTKVMFAGGWEYVGWLELPHYRLIKLEEERLLLAVAGEDYGLTSVNDARSGKPRDPERQRLAEIINRLNDLYGPEVSDDDKLHFANGITDRIERKEVVRAQVRNHSEDQVMHVLFPKKVTDAVLDVLSEHKRKQGGNLRC